MKKIWLLTIMLLTLILAGCQSGGIGDGGDDDPATVSVTGGKILGAVEEGVVSFKGIPFAKAPVDELRFAPPQPAEAWEETLDCTEFRDMPVQVEDAQEVELTYGEDCLNLNVWTPEDYEGQKMPVLVFIHGGAYSQGAAGKSLYTGERFAQDGVVQVNIEYRLNGLGFLADEALKEEYGVIGNAGVLDQIAGLEWVRDNISAFGGDPERVTICGESAGSMSVSNLIMSSKAKGLFQQAIMESGSLFGQPMLAPTSNGDVDQALATTKRLYEKLKVKDIKGLRGLDAQTVADNSSFSLDMTQPSNLSFFPVFDGEVIPTDPYQALLAGENQQVKIMTGFNTDEGTLFIPEDITQEQYETLVKGMFGDDAAAVLARYPTDGGGNTPTARARYLVKMGLRIGGDIMAEEMTKQGNEAYCYQFAYQINALDAAGLGTMHAMELPFVFDSMADEMALMPEIEAFKEEVHGYWLGFIKDGEPGTGSTSKTSWSKYTSDKKEMIYLGNKVELKTLPDQEDVAFFKALLWE